MLHVYQLKKTFFDNLTKLKFIINKYEKFSFEKKHKKVLTVSDSNFQYTPKNEMDFVNIKNICSDYHLKQLFLQQGWEIKIVNGTDFVKRFFRSDMTGYTVTMVHTRTINQPLYVGKNFYCSI